MNMDIPFKLEFKTFTDWTEPKILIPENFAHSIKELQKNNKKYSISVKENHNLSLLFKAEKEAKIFIDFLDMYPESYFENETIIDKPFISTNENERIIFSHNKTKDIEYPILIPGSHKVTIEIEEKKYYMFLEVTSLHIEIDQLEIMRNEVDDYIEGLAKKTRENLTLNISEHGGIDVHHTISTFVKYHKKIISSLIRIKENPKYEIQKKYKLKSKIESGRVDSISIKNTQRRNENPNNILTYVNTIKYDIDENKMIKRVVNIFRKKILYSLRYLEESINRIKEERYNDLLNMKNINVLIEHKNKLNMLLVHVHNYLNVDWNKEIMVSKTIKPRKLLQSRNYHLLYSVYLKIENKGGENTNILKEYQYFWKETSKLYEIWGYIKILELIEQCNFKMSPIHEWISHKNIVGYKFPFLDPGTRTVYKNDKGLKFIVYYDNTILNISETYLENPVFTNGKHNTPDLRIDIYVKDKYMKSIMADFKYRSYTNLERINVFIKDRDKSTVYKQLYDYSQASSLFVNSDVKRKRSDSAVHETWVLYPALSNKKGPTGHDIETNIRRIELSPSKNQDFLLSHLNRVIEEIISEE